jgi:L,D-transpeptidase catalytic domain
VANGPLTTEGMPGGRRDGRANRMAPRPPERHARRARGRAAYRHRPRAARFAVLAVLIFVATTAAGWRGTGHFGSAAPMTASKQSAESVAGRMTADQLPASAPAVPSPSARRSCPSAASACADLSADLSWLQSDGKITYGPVRIEPGLPRTPRGTFHVQWKAGAHYVSTEFNEPMPYAVFFAPGGIAFHGGSLTKKSHGCIHLDIDSARYYYEHLPVGAEVVVF